MILLYKIFDLNKRKTLLFVGNNMLSIEFYICQQINYSGKVNFDKYFLYFKKDHV